MGGTVGGLLSSLSTLTQSAHSGFGNTCPSFSLIAHFVHLPELLHPSHTYHARSACVLLYTCSFRINFTFPLTILLWNDPIDKPSLIPGSTFTLSLPPTEATQEEQEDTTNTMNISDDIVIEIVSHLDTVSIIRFLSVSKRFWKFRTNQRIIDRISPYQKYIKYQQWNKGLLESVKRNDFPQIFFFVNKDPNDYETSLAHAAFVGNHPLIHYFIGLGAEGWSSAIFQAAKGGHKDLVQFFISKKSSCDESQSQTVQFMKHALSGAARGGQMNLVVEYSLLIRLNELSPSKDCWNDAMVQAAEGGHRDIVDLMIGLGASDWRGSVEGAIKGGYLELVEFFCNHGDVGLHFQAYTAALYGHKHIVEWLFNKGCWADGFEGAAKGGHKDLVDFFIQNVADNDWDSGLLHATGGGHKELVEFFIEKGATKLDEALFEATFEDQREIMEFLAQKGAGELRSKYTTSHEWS